MLVDILVAILKNGTFIKFHSNLVIIHNLYYTDTIIPKIVSCSHSDHKHNKKYLLFIVILPILAAILKIRTEKH